MRLLLPSSVTAAATQEIKPKPPPPSGFMLPVATGIWILLVASGLGFLMSYANRPGEQGNPRERWLDNQLVSLSEDKPTLLLFAHPKCPCTKTSIGELDWVMSRCGNEVDSHVLFFLPDGADEDWCRTSSCWSRANMIADLDVHVDPESRTAEQFGIKTSGHVLLYDTEGDLMFEGGITQSRGHAGESPGRTQLVSLIRERANRAGNPAGDGVGDGDPKRLPSGEVAPEIDSTCVFGCPLHDPDVAARPSPRSEGG